MAKDLQQQLEEILNDFSDKVRNDVNESCMETARGCASKLKDSPTPKKSGKYAKSWAVKEESSGGFAQSTWVVYNKKYYYLTHLLEKGHVNRTGTRFIKGTPHISKAEEWAAEELPKVIINKLGG